MREFLKDWKTRPEEEKKFQLGDTIFQVWRARERTKEQRMQDAMVSHAAAVVKGAFPGKSAEKFEILFRARAIFLEEVKIAWEDKETKRWQVGHLIEFGKESAESHLAELINSKIK